VAVALRADDAHQPQARRHRDRCPLPDAPSDQFDPQFVRLDMLKVDLALLDQMLMDLVGMLPGPPQPRGDRVFIRA
jgi:hypothetical protein